MLHLEPRGFVLHYKRLEKGRLFLLKIAGRTQVVTWIFEIYMSDY
ncbi:MAG: hypothetical protein JJU02_06940 [Cryomorphaceae bacterium]|nr:hypothetical protein [Cryomorphaceae bacterium]